MRAAMKPVGVKITYPKNFTPVLTEQVAAAELSAVILPFSTGQLAQATGRSKDTVKCWKAGRTFPNGVSLIALVKEFPQIRAWANSKSGGFNSPQGMNAAVQIISGLSDAERNALMKLMAGRNG